MKHLVMNLVNRGQQIGAEENAIEANFGLWPPAKKAELQAVEESLGRKLPLAIANLYSTTNGWSIKWAVKDRENPERLITGRSRLPNLEFLFNHKIYTWQDGDEREDEPWDADTPLEMVERLREMFVLDDLEFGNYVMFTLPEDQGEPELFLYRYRNRLYPLRVSIEEYLELTKQTLGMFLWQQYVVADPDYVPDRDIPDRFHRNMRTLLPDADLSVFCPAPFEEADSLFLSRVVSGRREEFTEKAGRLKKDKRFKEVSFKPNPGVHAGTLQRIRENLGCELPGHLTAFYSSMNGFSMRWSCKVGDAKVEGRVILPPLEDVFGMEHGHRRKEWTPAVYRNVLWFDDSPLENRPLLQSLRRLEFIEGLGWDIAIRFVDEEPGYEIYLVDRGEAILLAVDFNDYLDCILETMGTSGWQLHLLDPESLEERNIEMTAYDQVMALFPDANLKKLHRV